MASPSPASVPALALLALPSDVTLCIFRFLNAYDIVSACEASLQWCQLVHSEALWKKACAARWPASFGRPLTPPGRKASAVTSLATRGARAAAVVARELGPLGADVHQAAQAHHAAAAAPANARSAVWRAFYLEHDLYEAANLAPAFLSPAAVNQFFGELGDALERVSPLVAAAAVESHTSFTLVRGLGHLRHLTLSHFKRLPEDNAARAVPVTSAEEVLGALKERRALDALSSLWLVDAQLAAAEVAKVIGLVGSSRLQVAAARPPPPPRAARRLARPAPPRPSAAASRFRPVASPSHPHPPPARAGARPLREPAAPRGRDGARRRDGGRRRAAAARAAAPRVGGGGLRRHEGDLRCALRDYPSLKTLDLSHNRIDHVGAEAVGALLQLVAEPAAGAAGGAAAASPARAAATSAAAGSAAAAAAPPPPSPGSSATAMEVDSVPPNPARLEVLDLSLNPLGETGIVALANGLQRNFVLQRLTLQYVNEQPVAAEGRLEPFPLTPLLTGNGLRELDMCHNFIAACGYNVDNLREALGTNAPLRHLNLRRCCIGGWRRARAIARGLAANTTLTSIDLGYNGLGAAAAQSGMPPASLAQLLAGDAGTLSLAVGALCQALRENRHLKHVGLAHNCLGDSGGCAVLHSALVGGSVTELDLRSNGLSIGALHCMSSALASRGVRWLPALPAALPGLGDADAAQPPQLPRTPPLQPQGGAHVTCAQILCQAPWRAAGPSSVRVDLRQNCSLELLMTTLDVPPVGLSLDESAVSQAVTAPEFRETPISLDVVGATKPPFGSPPPAMPPPDAPAAGGGARGGTRRQLGRLPPPTARWPFVGSGAAVCPYLCAGRRRSTRRCAASSSTG